MVVKSFMAVKAGRFVPAISVKNGLASAAPTYNIPIMVVNQSKEPIRMNEKLGIA